VQLYLASPSPPLSPSMTCDADDRRHHPLQKPITHAADRSSVYSLRRTQPVSHIALGWTILYKGFGAEISGFHVLTENPFSMRRTCRFGYSDSETRKRKMIFGRAQSASEHATSSLAFIEAHMRFDRPGFVETQRAGFQTYPSRRWDSSGTRRYLMM
jgi:hypothetical protein